MHPRFLICGVVAGMWRITGREDGLFCRGPEVAEGAEVAEERRAR